MALIRAVIGWSLRNPAFPGRAVTLRMLLSHSSSVRDHDDQYAIPLDGSVEAVTADPRSWDDAHAPGERYFAYANLNFPIVASIVEKVTGERFDRWMRAHVLKPMRIDACYNWPTCSDEGVARAVVLIQDGKPVKVVSFRFVDQTCDQAYCRASTARRFSCRYQIVNVRRCQPSRDDQ